jgi:alpha-1,2-mannosyltransferase
MGLRRMNWDSWIELDNEWNHFHGLKTERIASRGDKCVRTSPEAFDAACELLQELGAYLCERYPGVFRWTDRGAGVELENLHTKEKFDIAARPLPCDPLSIAARWIQDDIAIMIERPDGQYYLLGGAILLPGFWRLSDKFGMSLADIHFSGDVPGFKERLQTGMERFFKRLRPEEPVERNNYFVQVDEHLDWSSSIGGEDLEGIGWNTVCCFCLT